MRDAPHVRPEPVDLARERRPGQHPLGGPLPAPSAAIVPQHASVRVFMHGRPGKQFPPLFGTDAPPRGLSGRLRKLAYRAPDHRAAHWLALMVADRVDALEHGRTGRRAAVLGVLLLAAAVRLLRAKGFNSRTASTRPPRGRARRTRRAWRATASTW